MPDICLCMIVRNEEKNLPRCLQSVKSVVREIVIVDTGSTDRTKSIAQSFDAQIYDFAWTDNFADARNFSLEHSRGDWNLWMDADEELCMADVPALRALMSEEERDLIAVPMVHYYGSLPADDARAHLSASYRLFRAHRGIRFTGSIHEHLDLSKIKIPESNGNNMLKLLHYGYMEEEVAEREKGRRNLRLLLAELGKNPANPWLHYHIACEYCRQESFREAFLECDTAIKGFLEKELLPPSLVYKLKYDILIKTGNTGAAWPGIEKAVALYPDYVDLSYYMGIILLMNKQYDRAVEAFKYCLGLGEDNPRYLILRGTGSFFALYHLGICYQAMRQDAPAAAAFAESLALCPSLKEAEAGLASLTGETVL